MNPTLIIQCKSILKVGGSYHFGCNLFITVLLKQTTESRKCAKQPKKSCTELVSPVSLVTGGRGLRMFFRFSKQVCFFLFQAISWMAMKTIFLFIYIFILACMDKDEFSIIYCNAQVP